MGEVLVGTVLPFAGQVSPVNGNANRTWANLPCGGQPPAAANESPDAPVLRIESSGWMLCDGRYLSSTEYPELYAVLGTMYGSRTSAGVYEFAIPDFRGLFLRGFDAGAGLDPDAGKRLAPTGDHTDNMVGSLQCDALQSHTHHYDIAKPAGVSANGQAASITPTAQATSTPDEPARVSSETRAKNAAVNFVIKYR